MRILWYHLLVCVAVVGGTVPLAAQEPASTTEPSKTEAAPADTLDDEAAIRSNCVKYVEAYNRRDSRTMADMWSPEAVYEDPRTGEGVVGRDAIKEQFDYAMAGSEDAKLTVTIDSVEFVSPNVAIEKGAAVVTYGEHKPEESLYSAVHVKRDGKWLIDRISEWDAPQPPPSNYEHLKDLEWMVGSWIDQDESATIQTDCKWTKNRNFLTRSFAMTIGDQVEISGMQIIGWDPAAKQVRSWVFDSDGGFSEGTWTKKDNQWTIQSTGTLPTGGQTSAVNVLREIDGDSFGWQSTNREADGALLPNVDEVLVIRQPAERQPIE